MCEKHCACADIFDAFILDDYKHTIPPYERMFLYATEGMDESQRDYVYDTMPRHPNLRHPY